MEPELIKELEELRLYKEKSQPFIRAILAEQVGFIPFICGMAGEKDENNMQETVFICPAYGSDVIYVYRKESVSAPGW